MSLENEIIMSGGAVTRATNSAVFQWMVDVSRIIDAGGTSPVFVLATAVGATDSLEATVAAEGARAITSGGETPNDGAGGTYYWVDSGQAPLGYLIVKPAAPYAGNGRWILIYEGDVPMEALGIKINDNQANAPGNTSALQAAIDYFGQDGPGGGFGRTIQARTCLVWLNDEIDWTRAPSLTLKGAGKFSSLFQYTGPTDPTKTFFRLAKTPFSVLDSVGIFPTSGGHSLGVGVRVTSDGPIGVGESGPIQVELKDIWVEGASDAQIMIGSDTNIDVNTDRILIRDCVMQGGNVGLRISNTNTNNLQVMHGAIGNCTTYGIEVLSNPRDIEIDNIQMANNGTFDIFIRRTFAAVMTIKNMQSELSGYPFLGAEITGGGVSMVGTVKIEGWGASYNDPGGPPFAKIIDWKGTGTLHLVNCILDGPGGGNQAFISIQPATTVEGGAHTFITENVTLYKGAEYDVLKEGNGRYYHIDLGTTRATDPSTLASIPHTRLYDNVQAMAAGTVVQAVPAIPFVTQVDVPMLGRKSTEHFVDYRAFTEASPNPVLIFETVGTHVKVCSQMVQVVTPFAGVAGPLEFQSGTTGGTDWYILPFDAKVATISGHYQGDNPGDLGLKLYGGGAEPFGHMLDADTGNGQLACRLVSVDGHNLGTGVATNLTQGLLKVLTIYEETEPTQ